MKKQYFIIASLIVITFLALRSGQKKQTTTVANEKIFKSSDQDVTSHKLRRDPTAHPVPLAPQSEESRGDSNSNSKVSAEAEITKIDSKECDRCNMQEIDVENKNLSDFNFFASDFQSSTFRKVTINDGAFHQANLQKSKFKNSSMRNVNFSQALMNEVEFDSVDMTDTMLAQAILNGTDFIKTRVSNSNFFETKFSGAKFENSSFTDCEFGNARMDGLVGKNTSFDNSKFTNTDLSYADLSGASFVGANLYKANFKGANLRGANFQGALNFDQAVFEGANLCESIRPDGHLETCKN